MAKGAFYAILHCFSSRPQLARAGIELGLYVSFSGILTFKLDEPGEYVTTWFPGGPATFAVLMNQDVYDGLSDAERAAVDKVAGSDLSLQAARTYAAIGQKALDHAETQGLEVIELSAEERGRIDAITEQVMAETVGNKAGDKTVGDIVTLLKGQ